MNSIFRALFVHLPADGFCGDKLLRVGHVFFFHRTQIGRQVPVQNYDRVCPQDATFQQVVDTRNWKSSNEICNNSVLPSHVFSLSGGLLFHMLLVVVFVGLGKGRLIKDVSLALYKSTPARWHLAPERSFWLKAVQARARPPPPQPRQLFKVNCRIGSTARAIAIIYRKMVDSKVYILTLTNFQNSDELHLSDYNFHRWQILPCARASLIIDKRKPAYAFEKRLRRLFFEEQNNRS